MPLTKKAEMWLKRGDDAISRIVERINLHGDKYAKDVCVLDVLRFLEGAEEEWESLFLSGDLRERWVEKFMRLAEALDSVTEKCPQGWDFPIRVYSMEIEYAHVWDDHMRNVRREIISLKVYRALREIADAAGWSRWYGQRKHGFLCSTGDYVVGVGIPYEMGNGPCQPFWKIIWPW